MAQQPKTENKPVPKQQTPNALALNGMTENWGAGEDIDNSDILIPKILLMQGLSELVTEGKFSLADMIDSVEAKKLGDKNTPIELIVFSSFKTWQIFKDEEYVATVPFTAENAVWDQEREVMEMDGKKEILVQRVKTLNYYCLLANDIKAGVAFPYVVSFRMTSMTAGKKLATYIAKLRAFQRPSASAVFALKCTIEKNDKGTFAVFDVSESRKSTQEEVEAAMVWYKTLNSKNAKIVIDESDEMQKPKETQPSKQAPPPQDVPSAAMPY